MPCGRACAMWYGFTMCVVWRVYAVASLVLFWHGLPVYAAWHHLCLVCCLVWPICRAARLVLCGMWHGLMLFGGMGIFLCGRNCAVWPGVWCLYAVPHDLVAVWLGLAWLAWLSLIGATVWFVLCCTKYVASAVWHRLCAVWYDLCDVWHGFCALRSG